MPKVKTIAPIPSRHKNQRAVSTDPLYLNRFVLTLTHPEFVASDVWRNLVKSQLTCMDCKEVITGHILSLDWKVEPRDSEQRDELKSEIDYYTRFIEDTGDYEYSEVVEWLMSDYLDLPFGGATEVGREGDDAEGRVLWIELLDGGTMFPVLNADWPYAQAINGIPRVVYFPKHSINRMYMSPRTDIRRKGWGMAPPEKIYFALQLLSRGDMYYANLLLDSPEAGILDLMDMDKESAEAWVGAWRTMLTGIDPYKIPVLYEHTSEAKFIPFTRNPTDITFNQTISRYDALLCAGYGLTPSDISLGGGSGNTLAGSIRDEKKTKSQGFGKARKKMMAWWNRLLPEYLRFRFIDIDEETSVAVGRARLAHATAAKALIDGNIFTESEMRAQTVADGLITVSVPESLPKELQEKVDAKNEMAKNPFGQNPNGKTAERPNMLGRPVSPGQGGWGETAARSNVLLGQMQKINNVLSLDDRLSRLMYLSYAPLKSEVEGVREVLQDRNELAEWRSAYDRGLWDRGDNDLAELTSLTTDILAEEMRAQDWWDTIDWSAVVDNIVSSFHEILHDTWDMERKKALVIQNRSIPPLGEVDEGGVREWVERSMSEYQNEWKLTIIKAVISGFRNYLLDHPDVAAEDAVFMSDAMSCVKDYLQKGMVKLANKFAQEASDIIIHEIRKVLNHGVS